MDQIDEHYGNFPECWLSFDTYVRPSVNTFTLTLR
jgi:hypothetical protein